MERPQFDIDNNQLETTGASMLITEPYFNLPNIQDVYDQLVFEEYEFQSYYRCTPAAILSHGSIFGGPESMAPECILIVDSGFSFTHIVPLISGSIVWNAVKRIDIGGKLLTNHLKELTSYRQWNMMDETYTINHVKETSCFVSQDFARDLETCRKHPGDNPITQQYILPDFSLNRPGRLRLPHEPANDTWQILVMGNERFSVPEALFCPAHIGLDQSGLPEAIAHSIALLPSELQGMFWANVALVGGNAKTPGFAQRLTRELRTWAPADGPVHVYEATDPITETYRAAYAFAHAQNGELFRRHAVTRAEYLESGSNACRRKWRGPHSDVTPRDANRNTGTGRVKVNLAESGSDSEESEGSDRRPVRRRGGRGRGRRAARKK